MYNIKNLSDEKKIIDNIISFCESRTTKRNSWLEFKSGKVYLRNGRRSYNGLLHSTIELATIEATVKRRGFLSLVLKVLEEQAERLGSAIYVENVLYPWFGELLIRKGYIQLDDSICPSYLKTVFTVESK